MAETTINGKDDFVTAGYFDDQKNTRKRCLQDTADEAGHTQQGKTTLIDPHHGRPRHSDESVKTQPHECADDQAGGEDATRSAPSQGQGGGKDFNQSDSGHQHQPLGKAPFNSRADGMVAFAQDIG
jgi:hypothetical protein